MLPVLILKKKTRIRTNSKSLECQSIQKKDRITTYYFLITIISSNANNNNNFTQKDGETPLPQTHFSTKPIVPSLRPRLNVRMIVRCYTNFSTLENRETCTLAHSKIRARVMYMKNDRRGGSSHFCRDILDILAYSRRRAANG